MKYYHNEGLSAYSSPCVEVCTLVQEGLVCISFGEKGTAGGELRGDENDIWEV